MKNRSLNIVLRKKMKRVFPVLVAVVIMFVGIKIPYIPSIQLNVQAADVFNTYNLTETELIKIASLCQQEQGTAKGAAAEASLMANRFEMYGSKYSSVYDYARNSGWFAKAGTYMDKMNATDAVIDAVRNVLIYGKRTLPGYVDEHDCFSDLKSCTNNGVGITIKDRSQYRQFVTIINNVYGSKYTFYCFPTSSSDPFGYISETKRSQIGEAYYDYDTGELINGKPVPEPPTPVPTGEYFSKCSSGYSSLVEALNSIGVDSSKENRKRIAEANGISDYSYSAEQNTYMLNLLKEGMLINPDGSSTSPVEPEKKWYESVSPVDVGSDFYAYIINVDPWLHLKNNNGNVETASPLREQTQFWKFTRNTDGSYKIVSCADGNCLDVYGAYSDSGTNIQTYPAHDDTPAQKWFIYGESGNYVFRPACSDCVLDVTNASSSAGANIQIYTKNDSSAQKFQIWKEMAELSVTPGDKVNKTAFDWSDFLGDGIHYSLRIWKGTLWEGDSFKDVWNIKDRKDCEVELPVGHYEAYVDVCIGTEVQMTNVVKFDITEDYFGKSELSFVSGDKYNKTHFKWTPVEKAEFYDLKIWNGIVWERDAYQIEWNIKDTSIDLALPDGYYEAYVDARDANNMQMSNVIKFTIKEECVLLDGDANLDGEVTVADAVMLQKWLLGLGELICWQNVDLCEDNRIDVFDLCMLKKMLVNNVNK